MERSIKILIILFLINFMSICQASAADINASSVSKADIQTAIDSAVDGDTVKVPAGTATWGGKITISKGITLQGAGKDKTIIKSSDDDYILRVSTEQPFRITGFTFHGNNYQCPGIEIRGNSKYFRIDNNRFTELKSRSINIYAIAYGVIDHNEFIENGTTSIVVSAYDRAWDLPIVLGTQDAVYVEDNLFRNDARDFSHAISSNHGSRYVFRYNTIEVLNHALNPTPIDVHGNFFWGRGSVSFEIYNNTVDSAHSYQGILIRGGTGVIYNNTFVNDFYYPIIFTNYQSWNSNDDHPKGPCGYACCDYPCPDQINQVYVWNNTYAGSPVNVYMRDRGFDKTHVKKDRDYFMYEKPGYVPYTYPHPLTVEAAAAPPPEPSPPKEVGKKGGRKKKDGF